jgi:spermidine synthase
MDNAIQSCELDESLYHESLVHPGMFSVIRPKRVMIIGGGEGASAREALKWPSVERVDMYEWDQEVVQLFQSTYPQWAKGAWDDPRLHLHFEDIFKIIDQKPAETYDVIIIDLFDPEESNRELWKHLLQHITNWAKPTGSIAMYAGMRSRIQAEQPYQMLTEILLSLSDTNVMFYRIITPYRVFIPSFLGEATFLLMSFSPKVPFYTVIPSHMTEAIWDSYRLFNW